MDMLAHQIFRPYLDKLTQDAKKAGILPVLTDEFQVTYKGYPIKVSMGEMGGNCVIRFDLAAGAPDQLSSGVKLFSMDLLKDE